MPRRSRPRARSLFLPLLVALSGCGTSHWSPTAAALHRRGDTQDHALTAAQAHPGGPAVLAQDGFGRLASAPATEDAPATAAVPDQP